MTDKDRMDRAKRIREMREGSREGSDTPENSADEEQSETTEEPAETEEETTDESVETEEETVAESESDPGTDDAEKQTMEELVESAAAEEADESEPTDSRAESSDGDETSADADETPPKADETPPEAEESQPDTVNPSQEMTADNDLEESAEQDDPTEETDGVSAPLPDTEALEDALEESEADTEAETVAPETGGPDGIQPEDESGEEIATGPTAGTDTTTKEEETRVLEFTLDDEHYCLDIEYIEEIVKQETITRVPNTPEFVEGVVDLRGQITTILNPKVTLGKEDTDADELIVVFDAEAFEDQGHIGWAVDDVRQVSPIVESEVNDPPVDDDHINGVIDRDEDDQFVIWTSPELALEDAEG